MKPFVKLLLSALAVLTAVSCEVEGPGQSQRTKYSLVDYSSWLASSFIFNPAAAVAEAVDVDFYLSLTEEEKEKFDVSSLFPEGILHIDDKSVNIVRVASVYSDGNRFGTPGASWTVRSNAVEVAGNGLYYDYSSYYYHSMSNGYMYSYKIDCISDNEWSISISDSSGKESVVEGNVIVRLVDSSAGIKTLSVRSSGRKTDSERLYAVCGTADNGVGVQYVLNSEASSDDAEMVSARTLKPVAGRFNVDFYRDGKALDYCNTIYEQETVVYEVSID